MGCACQPPDLNLCLAVGTSPSWAIAVTNPELADAPVDITGSSSEFLVKASPTDDDADAVFTLTSDDGEIVITDATAGEAQIDNTAAKSALLEPGRWYSWYLRITLSSGEIRLARKGKLYAEAN